MLFKISIKQILSNSSLIFIVYGIMSQYCLQSTSLHPTRARSADRWRMLCWNSVHLWTKSAAATVEEPGHLEHLLSVVWWNVEYCWKITFCTYQNAATFYRWGIDEMIIVVCPKVCCVPKIIKIGWFFFYRATLCVSAVFSVALCPSVAVRPSVCLSRSCILSRWLKISSNLFVGPVVPSF